jgi:uncharacterized protein YndB with AHSA1/START domain
MKWFWSLLCALVLSILAIEITGAFLPSRLDVERERTLPASPEQVFEVLAELRAWPQWAPMLQGREKLPVAIEELGPERGLGAALLVRYGEVQQVLFTVVEFEPPRRLVLNSRSGPLSLDLLAQTGFEGWEEFDLEPVAGGTRVRWRRSGAEVSAYWVRVFDHFVVRGQVTGMLERGLEALAQRVAG